MKRTKEMTGMRFGSLEVMGYAGNSPGKARIALWECKCDCGSIKTYYGTALRNGTTTSCGCTASEKSSAAMTKHGKHGTRTYITWKAMKNRCTCETSPDYELYGKRGITVCERWMESFENFIEDMGERPAGMSLDRIDSNGNYEKSNCRWVTTIAQSRNKRNSVFVEYRGEKMTLAEFGEKIGMDRRNVRYWIVQKGMTPDEVVTKRGGVSTIEGALVS